MVGVIQFKFPLILSNEIISPLELLKITLSSFKITDVSFCELINFFLGRPDGFDKNDSEFEKISLSKMTFPHSLARVILCEQIYRCATILSNHPYHRC